MLFKAYVSLNQANQVAKLENKFTLKILDYFTHNNKMLVFYSNSESVEGSLYNFYTFNYNGHINFKDIFAIAFEDYFNFLKFCKVTCLLRPIYCEIFGG